MTCEELSAQIYERHIESITEMNKSKTEKEANELLITYYQCSCAVLAIQSLLDDKGDVVPEEVERKTKQMMEILLDGGNNVQV